MVVRARLGNTFITSPSTDERPCIYLYLVDDSHFHTITSITGFFCARYIYTRCLKHYNNRQDHECETSCIVCKTTNCPKTESPVTCDQCHMTCRSMACYRHHTVQPTYQNGKNQGKTRGPSECEKWWKCSTCYKVVKTTERKKEEHRCGEYYCTSCEQHVLRDHLCYLRATPAKEEFIPKYIFVDFECSMTNVGDYAPLENPNCPDCLSDHRCNSCSKCQRCMTSWCGKANHRPNFVVVAHTVCPKCIDHSMNPKAICKDCGSRCPNCNEEEGPCP